MDYSRKQVRYTLAILFAINLLNFYDRVIFGAVAEPIRKQWALTDSQVGWLATAFTLLYAVVGVPLGRLSDRGTRSRLLAVGVAAWSALTAAVGFYLELCVSVRGAPRRGRGRGDLRAGVQLPDRRSLSCGASVSCARNLHARSSPGTLSWWLCERSRRSLVRLADGFLHRVSSRVAGGDTRVASA